MIGSRQELSFLTYHEGLLYKLKQSGISGNLNIITDFLSLRQQRVVLNGQHSTWVNIEAGVPRGSILVPLFFLIYINDLSDDLTSNPKFFADNASLFSVVQNIKGSHPNSLCHAKRRFDVRKLDRRPPLPPQRRKVYLNLPHF